MQSVIEIKLSSGTLFKVRQLGLFELDNIFPKSIGPFTYTMEILGKEYEAEFNLDSYEEPPKKPDKPEREIQPNTLEHDQLLDWQLYQAGLLHNRKRVETTMQFYIEMKDYIIENACLDDPNLIVTTTDWQMVYDAAIVPQLTLDLIAATLNNTYSAKFNDQELLEALAKAKKGRGTYNVIKLWENKLMLEMNMTELEYAMIPLEERARKVCAMFLQDIMSFLEIDLESRINKDGKK